MATSAGSASPAATSGHVDGRCRAWSWSSSSPVSVKTMHAAAKASMNRPVMPMGDPSGSRATDFANAWIGAPC